MTRIRASAVFVFAIVLLCVGAASTYLSFSFFRSSEHWISHTQEVRAAVGDFEAGLNRAARARMGFLTTGDDSQLNEYRAAAAGIPPLMRNLRQLAADNPFQLKNIVQLEFLTQTRLQQWDEVVALKQQGRPVDFADVVQSSMRISSDSAAVTESIRAEENRLLNERRRKARHYFVAANVTMIVSFGVALLLLYIHYRWLTHELRAREEAEKAARQAYMREASLRQDEERFRLFVEAVKDCAIIMLDPEGRVVSWNHGAERIKGYAAAEIMGKHLSTFFTEEDVRADKPGQELQAAAEHGQFAGEAWRVRKDGSRFFANIVLTAIKGPDGKLEGFAKITRDVTERMRAQEALQAANANLQAEAAQRQAAQQKLAASEGSLRHLSLHLLRSQDEERKRIGRELHDSLGQYLAMLKMNLDSLQLLPENESNGNRAQIAECIHLAEESIKEVRTISYLLYPPMLEEIGLRSAVAWYLEGFSKRSNIRITLKADPDVRRLPRESELAMFRVLQESLTNVHRHSGSSVATVRLQMQNGHVVLQVEDQGKGISPGLLEESGKEWLGSLGVGLRGMRERMQQLGGRLEVSSSDRGTSVSASLPVDESVPAFSNSA